VVWKSKTGGRDPGSREGKIRCGGATKLQESMPVILQKVNQRE